MLPTGWDAAAHQTWLKDQKLEAIQAVIQVLNQYGETKPLPLGMQLCYYLYTLTDYPSAIQLLETLHRQYPHAPELLLNLGVCLSRSERYAEAVERAQAYLKLQPNDPAAYDILADANHFIGNFDAAREAGTQSLRIKNASVPNPPSPLTLPDMTPQAFVANKPNVIAFSLWGDQPRYLRGALDNALQRPTVYPDWRLRFYVDNSVPAEIIQTLRSLGAEIVMESRDQSFAQRLCWRFKVANDQSVGRFLVRDIDSVINPREAWAVTQWMASDQWFHVMRDWWSHTDLMLAGMWGGIAGLLPELEPLVLEVESVILLRNIDQYLQREKIWPLIRHHCLVHDRYYTPGGTHPWDLPEPADNVHVGQCVFTAHRAEQEARLAAWLHALPSLQLNS